MKINVLSLFDGISAGMVALERARIEVESYYASEIDKYAIKISEKNYPNTIRLGDVTKWQEWNLPKIDLLIGGSPCQGFSNAGLGLNFDDPRSKLFFTYVDILKHYKPKFFMLENVKMKREWQDVISEHLGVEPILINSALLSAQNRNRLYWANFPISQPEDRGLLLKDIIVDGEVDRTKSYCLDANYFRGGNLKSYKKGRRQLVFASNLNSEGRTIQIQGSAKRNQVTKRGIEAQINVRRDGKSNCVVGSYPNKLNGMVQVGVVDNGSKWEMTNRVYSVQGKSPTLRTNQGGGTPPKFAVDEKTWRMLTPLECERLQTFEDGFTDTVSRTQRYKALGNSWTVDVIAHIFKEMKKSS